MVEICKPGEHVVPRPRTKVAVYKTHQEMTKHRDERYFTCGRCGALVDIGRSSAMVTTEEFAKRLASADTLDAIYDLAEDAQHGQI